MMNHGSLFSGIDGFSEGAKRAGGIETIFHCEINKYCQDAIRKHSTAPIYPDIREFNATEYHGKIHILSGGFPCQDISAAGKGVGITGKKSGLWSHYARIIKEVNPSWVIIENSPRLLRKGFEKVLFDLSQIGYDAEWECISTAAFEMPHQRERLFIIAYPNVSGWAKFLRGYPGTIFSPIQQAGPREKRRKPSTKFNSILQFEKSMGEPALFGVDHGVFKRSQLCDRLAAIGNSISPVVAEYLFHCIKYAQSVGDEFTKDEQATTTRQIQSGSGIYQ